MSEKFWTPDRLATLRQLAADGYSLSEAAYKFGITRSALSGAASRAGIAFASGRGGGSHSNPDRPRAPRNPPLPHRTAPLNISRLTVAPPLAPPSTPPPAPADPIPLIDLTNETCRWPINDAPPFLFCGMLDADMTGGASYCRTHRGMAYSRRGEAA